MTLGDILADIHAVEEESCLRTEVGVRSETFYAAFQDGEEPEDDRWALDFGEWASVDRTWLTCQAEYRNESAAPTTSGAQSGRSIRVAGRDGPFRSASEDYELFLYTLASSFPRYSFNAYFARLGSSLARVSGELSLITTFVWSFAYVSCNDRSPMLLTGMDTRCGRRRRSCSGMILSLIRTEPALQSTHPHHKHIPHISSTIVVRRPTMSFSRPNLPELIERSKPFVLSSVAHP